jgi:TonB family protein
MKHILATWILVAWALAAPAIGRPQVSSGNSPGTPQTMSSEPFGFDDFETTPGEPFQLVEQLTTARTTPDGVKKNLNEIRHVFRDSQGRLRVEDGWMKDGVFKARGITILDPVALIEVDSQGRLIHLEPRPRKLPTAEDNRTAAERKAWSAAYNKAHPGENTEESLGTRVIAGEEAQGTRKKLTLMSADGSKPQMVTETWVSPELNISLLTILDDSERNHRVATTEVTELKRTEPDAELFKVPANLTTVQPSSDGSYPLRPGVTPPQITHAVPAVYPAEAPADGHWKTCELRVTVGEDGVPASVSVFTSVGDAFDAAAMEAVRQSRFEPGTWNGQAVPVRIHVEVNFSADRSPAIPEVKFEVQSYPFIIHSVDPEYSDEARRMKIHGSVVVSVLVTEAGLPTDMRVDRSLGHGLDEKALKAASQYRFKPATRYDGKLMASRVSIQFSFQLY